MALSGHWRGPLAPIGCPLCPVVAALLRSMIDPMPSIPATPQTQSARVLEHLIIGQVLFNKATGAGDAGIQK